MTPHDDKLTVSRTLSVCGDQSWNNRGCKAVSYDTSYDIQTERSSYLYTCLASYANIIYHINKPFNKPGKLSVIRRPVSSGHMETHRPRFCSNVLIRQHLERQTTIPFY